MRTRIIYRGIHLLLLAVALLIITPVFPRAADIDTLKQIGVLDGELTGDQFGVAIAGRGDLNNDGFTDLIVGANANDEGGDAAGKTYVYLGGYSFDLTADLTVVGGAADFLGGSVAVLGDVNNDTYDDFLIGASFNSDVALRAGKALLFYGGNPPNNTADLTFFGEAQQDYFGDRVANVGDLNNDGYADWAIGAYKADTDLGENTGKVYVYFGGSSPDNIVDLVIPGLSDGERFGASIAGIGNFNNDNYDDLVVGAYSYDNGVDLNIGRAYVFFGGVDMDSLPDLIFTGEYAFDFFGTTVAAGGDLNNDTYDDVVIGATGYDYQTFLDAGKIYVFYGGAAPDNTPDFTYTAQRSNDDLLGAAATIIGDINGDASDELLVGAEDDNEAATDAGKAYLFYGPPFSVDTTFTGELSGASFGSAVTGAKGIADGYQGAFAVGAWGHSDSIGRVYVYGMTQQQANQPPELAAIDPQSVLEGNTLTFTVSASDPDGTVPDLIAENKPPNSSFTDHHDGTGTFDFTPDLTQAGVYEVRFIATDGELDDTALVEITVTDSENCDCGFWGDVSGDGAINPVDVVFMVNYVYKNWDSRVQPPACPLEAGDVDCGGSVNPVDVVYFVNYVYKNWDVLCGDPCLP